MLVRRVVTIKRRFRSLLGPVLLAFIVAPVAAGRAANDSLGLTNSIKLPVNLEFSIADIEFSPGFKIRGIRVLCARWLLSNDRLTCTSATLSINETPLGRVGFDAAIEWWPKDDRWTLNGSGRLDARTKFRAHFEHGNKGTTMRIEINAIELTSVAKLSENFLPQVTDYIVESGSLTLTAECRSSVEVEMTCSVIGDVFDMNINGVSVAENLSANFSFSYSRKNSGEEFEFRSSLRKGAVYIEPGFELGSVKPGFFIEAGSSPIEFAARIARSPVGVIRILDVNVAHPDVLDMRFSGDLRFAPTPQWRSLDLSLNALDVKQFYAIYMQPIALDTAFSSLETAGAVRLSIVGADNQVDDLNLSFEQVYIDDDDRRFSLYGLNGEIALHDGKQQRRSHISWLGGAIYDVQIGSGRIDWVSSERNLKIASWQDVSVFDGEFRMDSLEIDRFSLANTSVALSGTLTPITLSALTAAFGSIPLSGKLSGRIPRLSYSANRLDMEGDLRINVFDGQIVLRGLQIDKMFSTVPVLSANISIDNLDLEKLTKTFSFGNISGRLSGKIDDLVLEAWRPIRFNASFATPSDDDDVHRISQQAVDNLGRLGAGTGTGLSQGWLSMISSYSYGRLGIGCLLAQGYCLMSGVKQAGDDGFYILTRGGILPPWIDVKGSGRRIKWQTLVDGIRQISEGNFELDIGINNAKTIH